MLLFGVLSSTANAAPALPNILILMAEDMSSRVGAFGDAVARTPNLDALAKEGVRYTQMFTTSGVCAPSRAAHILGMHQIATGTQHMRSSSRPEGGYISVPPEHVKAYPELMRAAGYYTYTGRKLDYQFSKPFPRTGPSTIWDKENADEPGWRAREPHQPFFGFRSFMVTHESGVFPPLSGWPNSIIHVVMNVMRWFQIDGDRPAVIAPEDIVIPPYYPDIPVVRTDMARHYNNIAHMDKQVGDILAQLHADGLADSTIVIWTTDHGDGLPRAKRDLYEAGIRVPMIIRWPEAFRPAHIAPGTLDHRLMSFVDLAPTLLQLAGVEPPDYLHGKSFASGPASTRDYIFASRDRIDEVPDRQRVVRDQQFKLISSEKPQQPGGHKLEFRDNLDMVREMRALYEAGELNSAQRSWFEAPGEERLFDVKNDPYELVDLSADPVHEETLLRLREAMNAWRNRMGDLQIETESEMVARIMPQGEQRVTPAPMAQWQNNTLLLKGASPHYSLSYRVDDGPWKLYTDAVLLERSANIEAKAERYGWKESPTISVP